MTGRIALAALALFATAHRTSRAPIVLKFSHVAALETPKAEAAEFFKRRAEELTGGRVRIEVHPDGALHGDKNEIAALQLGVVELLAPSLSKLSRLGIAEFDLFDLPFLFSDYPQVRAVTDGRIGEQLFEQLEAEGIRGLAYWDDGFRVFSANGPLRNVDDYRGLQLRIEPSQVLEAQVLALGALPRMLPLPDVQTALRAGVVDGIEDSMSNLCMQRIHEVQEHIALTRHGYAGYAVIANKKFWDALPPEIRRKLAQASKESARYANRIAKENDDECLANVEAAGTTEVHASTAEERLALKQALLPVHQQLEEHIGKELLREVYQAVRFDPHAP
jgi:C4-dicarboxylate-binding protein DctP